jgi:parallel beta-helix repeat protein
MNISKYLSSIIIIIIISVYGCEANQIYTRISTGDSLQDAIDKSNSNTIFSLESGVYNGPLNLTNCRDMTIKPRSGKVTIECSGANIGIFITGGKNIIIEGLSLNNSSNGIVIEGSRDCTIKGNYIHFNNGAGITIDGVSGSHILENTIRNEELGRIFSKGISVFYSNSNFISGNQFVLQTNGTFVDLFKSYNNNIMINQCGTIIDNSNQCACAEGCYTCENKESLSNNWSLDTGFC